VNISLRAIEQKDLSLMKQWRNSDVVRPYVREFRFLSDRDQDNWWVEYSLSRRDSDWGSEIMIIQKHLQPSDFTALVGESVTGNWEVSEQNTMPIGVGGFTRIQWRNRRAELTFYVGELEQRTADVIVGALYTILRKGFWELNLHKITWPVFGNDPNLPIYQKLIPAEAILKEEYFWGGRYYDRYYLSLTARKFDKLPHRVLNFSLDKFVSISRRKIKNAQLIP